MSDLSCYYCLMIGIKPTEKTKDGYWICPNCKIDAVIESDNPEEIYAHHSESFHHGMVRSGKMRLIPCNHNSCKDWNNFLQGLTTYKTEIKP